MPVTLPIETRLPAPGERLKHRSRVTGSALLLLMAGALLALPASAQWTWRDKSGQVNASDRPPPREVADKDILSRPPAAARSAAATAAFAASAASIASAAATPAPAASSALEKEVESRKLKAEQEQAAKAKTDEARAAAVKAENCRRARGAQTALESGQRMARTNEKGEREVLDDRGRAEELRQARSVMESDCR